MVAAFEMTAFATSMLQQVCKSIGDDLWAGFAGLGRTWSVARCAALASARRPPFGLVLATDVMRKNPSTDRVHFSGSRTVE